VPCTKDVFTKHTERKMCSPSTPCTPSTGCAGPVAAGPHLTRRGGTPRILGGVPANLTNRALRIVRVQVGLGVGLHIETWAQHPGPAVDRSVRGGARFDVVLQGSEH
jgi:hypothetical protein